MKPINFDLKFNFETKKNYYIGLLNQFRPFYFGESKYSHKSCLKNCFQILVVVITLQEKYIYTNFLKFIDIFVLIHITFHLPGAERIHSCYRR